LAFAEKTVSSVRWMTASEESKREEPWRTNPPVHTGPCSLSCVTTGNSAANRPSCSRKLWIPFEGKKEKEKNEKKKKKKERQKERKKERKKEGGKEMDEGSLLTTLLFYFSFFSCVSLH
jgi:hypothetical protein